ncbi:MAG: serine hydrolase, partial [Candidatus Aminicenantes bacterium]|nr:serine hydrolase [Candidatus Aminicenantes bacterium]
MKKRTILLIGLAAALIGAWGCGTKTLPSAAADAVGMSEERLSRVHEVIKEAIARKELPGAVLLVARKGKVVLREAYGESQWVPEHKPMAAGMIFDLASVTKPVATATSILLLAERGRISLWDRVKMHVPEFAPYVDEWGQKGEDARIWNLLTHTSGLPPYTDAAEAGKKLGSPCATEALVKYIAILKKTNPPGAEFHYSCLGYITMAHIVKKVSGLSIDAFAEQHIFKPLKMYHTLYKPASKYPGLSVPTQVVDGKPLIGVV